MMQVEYVKKQARFLRTFQYLHFQKIPLTTKILVSTF